MNKFTIDETCKMAAKVPRWIHKNTWKGDRYVGRVDGYKISVEIYNGIIQSGSTQCGNLTMNIGDQVFAMFDAERDSNMETFQKISEAFNHAEGKYKS